MDKEKIIIVAEKERVVYHRFALILKNDFLVKEFYVVNSDKADFILKRWFFVVKSFKRMLKEFKPDKILLCGGSLISIWPIIFLIKFWHLNAEIISFRYDIEYFRPYPRGFMGKLQHFIARKLEKISLINSNKIIHKGSEDELQFLPFYGKVKNKRHYLLKEFLDEDLIQKYYPDAKLSKKDGMLHLAYGGGWYYDDVATSDSFFKLYEPLLKNNCHLHVYTEADEKRRKRMEDFEKKYPNFHYEGYISREKLVKEYQKYDFGLNFYGFLNKEKNKSIFVKTAFSNKNFDYVAAMLPILTNKEATVKSDFAEKNGIGYSFNLTDYNNPLIYRQIMDKKEYKKLIINLKNFIKKNLDNGNFIKFIAN